MTQSTNGLTEAPHISCDVCVIGGGSGGFGAALAAARSGASVVLIEARSTLGGTSTMAFVANWEPGPGCSFAREIYQHLSARPGATAIARRIHKCTKDERYEINTAAGHEKTAYDDSLRRSGIPIEMVRRVVVIPEQLSKVLDTMLREAGVRILCATAFQRAEAGNRRVRCIHAISTAGEHVAIEARVFVDATGSVHVARDVGCETMMGAEAGDRFGEPSAPERPNRFLNSIALCYRIRKSRNPERQPAGQFRCSAFICGIDESELIVNPMALVQGNTLIERGYEQTLNLAQQRVLAHWHWLNAYPCFRQYELKDIAPMLGIREDYRVVSEYILTEHDIRAGLTRQKHADIIAIADHALDIHGGSRGTYEIKEVYGIPYRCLIARGWDNLLVACRGAGFSHIAASSCRLSRTMMALGHAAGIAAAEAVREDKDIRSIDVPQLVRTMDDFGRKKKPNQRMDSDNS